MRSLLVAAAALSLVSGVANADPIPLTNADAVKTLCEGLRPLERMDFSDADKSAGRAEFERNREKLHKTDYTLELPWGAFTVAEWDPEQKLVTLSTERPFRALDGVLTFFDADRDEIELEASDSTVDELKAGLAKGTLTLGLVFRPAEEEGSPCVIGKAKNYALAVDLVSAELRFKGKPLAKAVRDGFEPRSTAGGKPEVEISSAAQDCEKCSPEVVDSAQKAKPGVEKCYLEALSRSPALDGTVVLALDVAADGKLLAKSVVADSLQDSKTVACIKDALSSARSATKNGHGLVVVRLERK